MRNFIAESDFLGTFADRAEGKLYFLMTKCLTRRIRRRCVDELRNKFALGKLGQAAKSVVFSDTIHAACKRDV